MPICPHCGSYVSEGSPICSCGASFGGRSYEEEEDPEEIQRKEVAEKYYRKGCSLEREGRYAEALKMYEKSRQLGSSSFIHYDEALLYNKMGDYERALEILEKFKGSSSYNILMTTASTLTGLGRYDEALELYFKAIGIIEKSPKFIQDYSSPQYGMYFTKEELDEQAREKQKRKREELSIVYAKIAITYSYDENFKVAIKYADEAIEYGGDVANNWNVKAIILKGMHKYDESLKCYDKAIEMKGDKVFIENKARMIKQWCGELCNDEKDLERSEDLIFEAIEMLSSIQTDEDMRQYWNLKDEIQRKLNPDELDVCLEDIGRENLITIVGNSFCGFSSFEKGMVLNMVREPDNEFDRDAIAVFYCGRKVGYVANSPNTVCSLTTSASELKIGDNAYAEYVTKYKSMYDIARLR